jgi:hypothetical protein
VRACACKKRRKERREKRREERRESRLGNNAVAVEMEKQCLSYLLLMRRRLSVSAFCSGVLV